MIREAATRVLAGETVDTIATDWRKRGVPGAMGKPWRPSRGLAKMTCSFTNTLRWRLVALF